MRPSPLPDSVIAPSRFFQSLKTSPQQVFIGITGGIGSGKSAVASIIRAEGHHVLSADEIARELTASDAHVKQQIQAIFGEVYRSDGTLKREELAQHIFGNTPAHERAREQLNAIIHPAVWKTVAERAQSLFASGERYVFNETALLFETGAEEVYDIIVVVDAQETTRVQRLAAGRDIDPEEAQRRIASQMSGEEKKARADYIIRNDGSREDLQEETLHFLHHLQTHSIQRTALKA